ncbi:MAG: ATP-binding protein [Cyanobacteria bacterium P01_A01_bin.123]
MHSPTVQPHQLDASDQPLRIDSVLLELPLYDFQLEATCLGETLAAYFEQYPHLPGVVLVKQAKFFGMIARHEFLEYLLRPEGLDLFLQRSLQVLHSYARPQPLLLSGDTPIIAAAQQFLRRATTHQNSPIVVDDNGQFRLLNVHDLNVAYWQIRGIETQVRYERSQAQILQSQKMAALGRLVDGVAHEILDPIGFIWGNLVHVQQYSQDLLDLIEAYETTFSERPPALETLRQDIELDYLQRDLPLTVGSIQNGAARIKNLAASLQNFCHIDEIYPKPADVHSLLDSILLLFKSRLTTKIQVVCNYGHLPPLACYGGQLSQVFMNILSNLIDTLLEQTIRRDLATEFDGGRSLRGNPAELPQIMITTDIRTLPEGIGQPSQEDDRWVSIIIADNGPGLSPKVEQQLQQAFSIETRMFKETSLAMSYRIITAKHGGKFLVRSRAFSNNNLPESVGTEFQILLPLNQSER